MIRSSGEGTRPNLGPSEASSALPGDSHTLPQAPSTCWNCLERMGMVGSGQAAVDLWCGQSGGCDRARDLVPGGESDGHFATVFVGVEAVTAWSKVRRYPTERGQKPLRMPG